MRISTRIAAVFLTLVAVLAVAPAAHADTAGPAFTGRTPADGAVVTGPFSVYATLTDPDEVQVGATVTVDGTAYPATFRYRTYWVGDGCDAYEVEDRTVAYVSRSLPDLPAGAHPVTITARDVLGNVSSDSFQVNRASTISFSGQTPVPASRNKAVTRVAVSLSGAVVDPASVTMAINGVPVVPLFVPSEGDPSAGTVSYDGMLTDGTKSVVVTAQDAAGNPAASVQWSFLVDSGIEGPAASSVVPAAGTVVQGPFTLSLRATDANGVNGSAARVTVDGLTLTPSSVSYPYGYWDGDGCEAWWVTDRTRCDLTFSVPDLAPGPRSLSLKLVDDLTDSSTTSCTVTRSSDLTFGSLLPADGSRVGATARLSALVTGPAEVATATVTMRLDGVQVPAVWDASSRVVSYDAVLGDGSHTVMVSAADVLGNVPASRTWSFVSDVSAPVLVSARPAGMCPDALNGVHVVLSDADGIEPSSVRLQLDGVVSPMALAVAGDVTTASWEGVLAEGSHEATFTATDLAGNGITHAWTFEVADPPRFGAATPAPGTVVGTDATFTLPVRDENADLDAASAVASLDGVPVGAGLTLTDARHGTVRVPLSGLADGPHTLAVSVTDAAGNVGHASVSFATDGVGPSASSASPSAGSQYPNHVVHPSVWFSDPRGFDLSSTTFEVDGEPVAFQTAYRTYWEGDGCDAYEVEDPTQVRVYSSVALHDGEHAVRVRTGDAVGNVTTHTWTFSVLERPTIGSLSPAPGTSTLDREVAVSATALDYDGVAAVSVRWRRANTGSDPGPWETIPSSFDPAARRIETTFSAPWSETRYELEVTATDIGGNASSSVTNVYVGTAVPTMEAGTDCLSCHADALSTHPMADCAACHDGQVDGPCAGGGCHGPGGGGWTHPASWMDGDRFEDHGGYYTGRTCTDCHTHDARTESMRHWSSAPTECEPCHERAVTTEHAGRTDDGGAALTCGSCHASTDPTVSGAIAAADTGCRACHEVEDLAHSALHEGDRLDGRCNACHHDNLSTEHLDNQVTQSPLKECGTCHESGEDVVTGAVETGDGRCFACHTVAHSNAFAERVPDDIPLYPGLEWSVPEQASLWSGAEWLPEGMAGGRLVFSSRDPLLDPDVVCGFFSEELIAAGWEPISEPPPPGADAFSLAFAKQERLVTVWLYGGADHDASPLSPAGYRVEVMYR